MDAEKERPNIRIEIQNENMEVDQSENEDGEIVDDEPNQVNPVQQNPNRLIFTTGINIFDQEEQKKLQERAKRFSLKPNEIHSFTDADLEELRESLGITEENENIVRFDTLHLLGTQDMLVENILEYFAKYAPAEIECVDEKSCNIKWIENISAARAMFYTSKAVKGMPVREQVLVKDFLDNEEEVAPGQSILLKNRKVELRIDDIVTPSNAKDRFKNAVDISEITIPIPPGYWRMGDKHPKAKCLLVRFAFKTDKKPYKIENLRKYYKKLGTAKSQMEKRREGGSIFDRNKDLPRGKNPWGSLARNWDQDAKFRESIPTSGEIVEVKTSSLATRLGVKGDSESENEVQIVEEQTTVKKPKGRSMRMRMYADEEEERLRMRKAIQKIKNQTENLISEPKDLRTILSLNNYSEPIEIIDLVQDDLGKKLKNRSRQMVFSIDRDPGDASSCERKENIRADVRSVLNRRRGARSPPTHDDRRTSEPSRRYRPRSPVRRHESPVRRRSPLHRRRGSPERTVRVNRHSRYQEQDYSDREEDARRTTTAKPRSKVAVVIKTQKKPTVASTIWSRIQESESDDSSSESEEDSSKSESEDSSSSSEESESDSGESESGSSSSEEQQPRKIERPGFNYSAMRMDQRSHLKITMANDRYRR